MLKTANSARKSPKTLTSCAHVSQRSSRIAKTSRIDICGGSAIRNRVAFRGSKFPPGHISAPLTMKSDENERSDEGAGEEPAGAGALAGRSSDSGNRHQRRAGPGEESVDLRHRCPHPQLGRMGSADHSGSDGDRP